MGTYIATKRWICSIPFISGPKREKNNLGAASKAQHCCRFSSFIFLFVENIPRTKRICLRFSDQYARYEDLEHGEDRVA